MTDSVYGFSVLPDIQYLETDMRVETSRLLSAWFPFSLSERPEFDVTAIRNSDNDFSWNLSLDVFSTKGYSARQRWLEIRAFPLPGELPRCTEPHLPDIPLATRSQQVVFSYEYVIRAHRRHRTSGGLPRGEPRTRNTWICLQLSDS